ncbi:divalent-cation tolerance protein CutA [Chitinibacteraceae bacterium HSL-7]
MDESDVWMVMCNCPDESTARQLAEGLVSARLAACVNQMAPVRSVYHWEGQIETATEVPLLIKTTSRQYAELETWLVAAHPYDVPEIVAVPLISGLPAYLQWVRTTIHAS